MRAWAISMVLVVGCGEARDASAPAPVPQQENVPVLTPQAQAVAFVEAAGKASASKVDWPSVTRANALAMLQAAASMDPSELARLSPGGDPLAAMHKSLSELDAAMEGAAMAETFANAWAGAKGCVAKPAAERPLAKLGDADVEGLPPAYAKTLEAVHSGKAFDLRCGEVSAMVVLGEDARVVAMEPPRKRPQTLELDPTSNRFAGYANAPDE